HAAQGDARPFADGRPALDAVVLGHLHPALERVQLVETEAERLLDEAADFQAPPSEVVVDELAVMHIGRRVAVEAEIRGDLRSRVVLVRAEPACEETLDRVDGEAE